MANLLRRDEAELIGHDPNLEHQCQQFDPNRKQCDGKADVIMLNIILADDFEEADMPGSMVRHYCAPCWYKILMETTAIYSHASYIDGAIEAGANKDVHDLLQSRIELIEQFSKMTHEILEDKYPEFLESAPEEEEDE